LDVGHGQGHEPIRSHRCLARDLKRTLNQHQSASGGVNGRRDTNNSRLLCLGVRSLSTLTLLGLHLILTLALLAGALALLPELLLDGIEREPRGKQSTGSANKTTGQTFVRSRRAADVFWPLR
jgi:hypothetical protein